MIGVYDFKWSCGRHGNHLVTFYLFFVYYRELGGLDVYAKISSQAIVGKLSGIMLAWTDTCFKMAAADLPKTKLISAKPDIGTA